MLTTEEDDSPAEAELDGPPPPPEASSSVSKSIGLIGIELIGIGLITLPAGEGGLAVPSPVPVVGHDPLMDGLLPPDPPWGFFGCSSFGLCGRVGLPTGLEATCGLLFSTTEEDESPAEAESDGPPPLPAEDPSPVPNPIDPMGIASFAPPAAEGSPAVIGHDPLKDGLSSTDPPCVGGFFDSTGFGGGVGVPTGLYAAGGFFPLWLLPPSAGVTEMPGKLEDSDGSSGMGATPGTLVEGEMAFKSCDRLT
mmetsp:Transcript_12504/g.22633  ORF Transcript_12504/g.22633 Transcript_12504/m.22633 type:complete len:251 (+) Transcript_12504:558-1310(+)